MPEQEMKFKQIAIGQWNGGSGLSFSVVGLTEDGRVFKHTMEGWVYLSCNPRRPRRNEQSTKSVDDGNPW